MLGITDGTRTEVVSGGLNEGDFAIVDESGGGPKGPGGPGGPPGGMRMRMF
ncbi:hypothetical protein [Vulgatibacter incomptus]|nr:hypothetical protein [Vulgatibacter incomptus]